MMRYFLVCAAVLASFFELSVSLECYVCSNQENNFDKCVTTIKTCSHSDDRCLSLLRWGSTPYWAPTGEKQFYISKDCSNKTGCDQAFQNASKRCDRIWYNDWECAECCYGDRCNYYVTLAGASLQASLISTVTVVTLLLSFVKGLFS